jgi:hypothetical protein
MFYNFACLFSSEEVWHPPSFSASESGRQGIAYNTSLWHNFTQTFSAQVLMTVDIPFLFAFFYVN